MSLYATPIPHHSVISVFEEAVPDRAVSSHVYSTPPRRFKDGTLSQPIQLDKDELSEALSDLTNTQLPPRKQLKRLKRVFKPVKSQGAVLGKDDWETDNDKVGSPNLLEQD